MTRIVVADDEAHLCDLIAAIFRRKGFDVTICHDGEALLKTLDEHTPVNAIVMDTLLPFVDGFDLVRQIRKHPTTSQTPLLLLTDLSSEEYIIEAFRLQVNEVLSKPFQPGELVARVMRWMGQPPLPALAEEES